jgi:NAD(P)H-dependent FMN reductase
MKIAIISGSTRINRQSHRVSLHLYEMLKNTTAHQAILLDLAEYQFPVFEEVLVRHPNPPKGLEDFAKIIAESDAFIFVSPEYNGSYSASLKNALEYLKENEFSRKVVGVASVSAGDMGGIRGAVQMQQLILGIGGYCMPGMYLVPQVQLKFSENGTLLDETFLLKTQHFIKEFLWFAEAVYEKKMVAV